jgi:hypothetical protein
MRRYRFLSYKYCVRFLKNLKLWRPRFPGETWQSAIYLSHEFALGGWRMIKAGERVKKNPEKS